MTAEHNEDASDTDATAGERGRGAEEAENETARQESELDSDEERPARKPERVRGDDEEEDDEITSNDAQQNVLDEEEYPIRVLAGAGTGKTYTMVEKITDRLKDDVPPEEILALTFTNKAAESMRNKLLDRVGGRAHDIDAYTYHAICHELLSEYPYYAGVDPEFEVLSDLDRYELLYDAVEAIPHDFTSTHVTAPEEAGYGNGTEAKLEKFVSEMKSSNVSPDDLEAYLPAPETLAEYEATLSDIGDYAADELKHRWRKMTDDRLAQLREELGAVRTYIAECRATFETDPETGTPTETATEIDGSTDANAAADDGTAPQASSNSSLDGDSGEETPHNPDGDGAASKEEPDFASKRVEEKFVGLLNDLIEFCDNLDRLLADRRDDIVDGSDTTLFKMPAYLFGAYSDTPKGLSDVEEKPLEQAHEVVGRWQLAADLTPGYRAYQQEIRESGRLDYDDLIAKAINLLDRPEVAETVEGRWSYVFCDEFQDTDTAQFELIQRLVSDDQVFVVGDDDQAIYEWRGANPQNITTDIEAVYPELKTHTLETNYRSREPILEFANEMIEGLTGRASDKELDPSPENEGEKPAVATIKVSEADPEAEQLGAMVRALVMGTAPGVEEEYEPGDISVLVRKRNHARPIIDALEKYGIPYELGESLTDSSPGVETVLAYLRVIADPSDELRLNRLLLLRYRLTQADRARLNRFDGSLREAIKTIDIDGETFDRPKRVKAARDHLTHLWAARNVLSLSQLYEELKEVTDLEWFLTERERRDLSYVDDLISGFDNDAPVENVLSQAFIDQLRYSATTVVESGGEFRQRDPAEDAVSLMTVHKSKGLEFPVVVMPRLMQQTWSPETRTHAQVRAGVEGKDASRAEFTDREIAEQRRVFHVGATRAEELLVLSGTNAAEAEATDIASVDLEELVPSQSELRPSVAGFDVWEEITDALPESALDWTTTAEDLISAEMEPDEADSLEGVLKAVAGALDGSVEAGAVDPLDIPETVLEQSRSPTLLRQHSYTAADTYQQCPRWHYLSHVVRAFDDPEPVPYEIDRDLSNGEAEPRRTARGAQESRWEASAQDVGQLFHRVAEEASKDPALRTEAEWKAAARQFATSAAWNEALPAVDECIKNYFQSELANWRLTATERRFELDLSRDRPDESPLLVTGYIDAVYEHMGDHVVVDYKTGSKSLKYDVQAKLYALACAELYDNPVDEARIVYVGDGPHEYDAIQIDDDPAELRSVLRPEFNALEDNKFDLANPGDHCRFCPHRNLPCSQYQSPD